VLTISFCFIFPHVLELFPLADKCNKTINIINPKIVNINDTFSPLSFKLPLTI
jgi:hypothetical protein